VTEQTEERKLIVSDDPKKLKVVYPETEIPAEPIPKPEEKFSLDKFKSKNPNATPNVETLPTALSHGKFSEAKDFVRLHPDDDNYWSPELCFVNVPIIGQKRDLLHLIDEEVALRNNISDKKILRFRLVLATKPYDAFFLCHIPSQNLDNSWNASIIKASQLAKTIWTQVSSQKERGIESYKIDPARDNNAFAPPKWPTQPLNELIIRTFEGNLITTDEHPGLLRIVGAKQSVS
jgi:hypothetical protein